MGRLIYAFSTNVSYSIIKGRLLFGLKKAFLSVRLRVDDSTLSKEAFFIMRQRVYYYTMPYNRVDHRWNRSSFSTTGTGTGLNRSDRTGPAGLPV